MYCNCNCIWIEYIYFWMQLVIHIYRYIYLQCLQNWNWIINNKVFIFSVICIYGPKTFFFWLLPALRNTKILPAVKMLKPITVDQLIIAHTVWWKTTSSSRKQRCFIDIINKQWPISYHQPATVEIRLLLRFTTIIAWNETLIDLIWSLDLPNYHKENPKHHS